MIILQTKYSVAKAISIAIIHIAFPTKHMSGDEADRIKELYESSTGYKV